MYKHLAIHISNRENKKLLLKQITSGELIHTLANLKGAVFSEITLNKFIDEEMRHGRFDVRTKTQNSLKNSSEGERKRALLNHILSKEKAEYIILDNVFDCLDVEAQVHIEKTIEQLSHSSHIIQITTRKRDILSFIDEVYCLDNGVLQKFENTKSSPQVLQKYFVKTLPRPYFLQNKVPNPLIKLKNVCITYGNRPILKDINWEVKPGEFWQLMGPNGSGKSTILNLITGDNPKGFLQDMILFGMKKGSGETVWDIKKHIGFFSSEMLRGFRRRDSILNMIVSGFLDSVGLYKVPTERHVSIANEWLELLNMQHVKDKSFQSLSNGHKRLVLIARAMVKHPPLLILDEPTNGLDDADAQLFAELVNKIAKESDTAIIYVSHRKEEYIHPDYIYKLRPSELGSEGVKM